MEDISHSSSPWPADTVLFRVTRTIVRALLRVLFRFRVEGIEYYPAGPAVIVANHPSALDPLFVAAAVPERVLFLAAREYFSMPFVGWALRTHGCIPVRRGEIDTAAIRDAQRALAAGRKIAMFPEGHISPHPAEAQRGAALLAARARASLLPIATIGTGRVFPLGARWPRLARVTVRIGRPLPPPSANRTDQESATAAAMAWIHAENAGSPDRE
ncbi:MAG: lysophospholipid acyltransferase family protein [Armatimonadota bacterium]